MVLPWDFGRARFRRDRSKLIRKACNPGYFMKFNYNLYRPKKFIEDVRKINNSYFKAKDVNIPPLTKIGDADKLHREQSEGRIPALAKKLRPSQLTSSAILSRRSVAVRNTSRSKKIGIKVLKPDWQKTPQTKLSISAPAVSAFVRILQIFTTRVSRMPMGPLIIALLIITGGAGLGSYQIVSSSDKQDREPSQQRSSDTKEQRQTTSPPPKEKQQTTPAADTPTVVTAPSLNAGSNESARKDRQNNTNSSIVRPTPRTSPLLKNQGEAPTTPNIKTPSAPSNQASQTPPQQQPAASPPQEPNPSQTPPTTQQPPPPATEDGSPVNPAPPDQFITETLLSLPGLFDNITTYNRYPESTYQ